MVLYNVAGQARLSIFYLVWRQLYMEYNNVACICVCVCVCVERKKGVLLWNQLQGETTTCVCNMRGVVYETSRIKGLKTDWQRHGRKTVLKILVECKQNASSWQTCFRVVFRLLVNSSLKGCYVVFDKNVPKLSTECEGKAVLILGCLCILLHRYMLMLACYSPSSASANTKLMC